MRTIVVCITLGTLVSCSGPSYFNSPADFVGGNRAAAVETYCGKRAGVDTDAVMYKLCEQSFSTHYGK